MKKSVLLTLFTALLFSSCNLTLDGTPRGSGAGNGSIPSEETNVKINFGREALLYEGEADPRYVILPNFSSLTSLSDYEIEKIRVYVDSTTQDFNIAHGQTSIELRITQESHTIKLEGLDVSDKVVLKSDDWTGTITSGIVVPLGLKPFSQDASATDKGSVKLTINFPAKISGENAISYYVVKCDVDGKDADETGLHGKMISLENYVTEQTFTITDLDPGTHHVNITICRDNSFLKNATISFNAIVYAGLESSTVYDHSSQLTSAITYTHNDFKSVTIHDYALCVNGNGGKFPSNGISELPSGKLIGGKDRCIVFESIKEALDFTQDGNVGLSLDNEYTVYISGEIKASDASDLQDGTNLVEIGLTGKTVNLTGYKETASDTPTLNANSKGRVLKVSAGTVKINDLTITGGDAGTANGGGILVNNGATVYLEEESSIKSCSATYGGGISVAAGGTLYMNGGVIEENEVSETGRGGGVYLAGPSGTDFAKLYMSGGEIRKNSYAAVYVDCTVGSCALFDMSGDAYIPYDDGKNYINLGRTAYYTPPFTISGNLTKNFPVATVLSSSGTQVLSDDSLIKNNFMKIKIINLSDLDDCLVIDYTDGKVSKAKRILPSDISTLTIDDSTPKNLVIDSAVDFSQITALCDKINSATVSQKFVLNFSEYNNAGTLGNGGSPAIKKNVEAAVLPKGYNGLILQSMNAADDFKEIIFPPGNNIVEDGVVYNKEKTLICFYPPAKEGDAFTIPNGVKSIGTRCFVNNQNLKTINLNDVETVDSGTAVVFYLCKSLEQLDLSNVTTTKLGVSTISECSSLIKVIVPSSISEIANRVFSECPELKEVHFLCSSPPLINAGTTYKIFKNVNADIKIYVPAGSKDAYLAATGTKGFANSSCNALAARSDFADLIIEE